MPGEHVNIAAIGAFKMRAIAVATAAATALPTTPLANRRHIKIVNLGPNAIFLGHDVNVTTATGFQLAASTGSVSIDLGPGQLIFAIAATALQVTPLDTRILETA